MVLIIANGLVSCGKETSVDSYTPPSVVTVPFAKGSLHDSTGNCQNITIHGSFVKGVALNATNYITAQVNFTTAGKYNVFTYTANGCWFSTDTAVTTSTGTQTVTLKGYGTPTLADTAIFTVVYLNSSCSFSLITTPAPHVPSETDYFPMTSGSYIIYKRDSVPDRYSMSPLRFSFNGLTETYNGNLYRLATSNEHDTNYYRKDGQGHYYEYAKKLSSLLPSLEYMMLDETKNVGQSWQTDTIYTKYNYFGTITDIKVVLRCSILAKNVTFNYITPSLDSTIEVQEKLLVYDYQGNDFSSALIPNTVYYTKKVGMVEYDSQTGSVFLRAKEWYIQ
jgi:hypothetical protein